MNSERRFAPRHQVELDIQVSVPGSSQSHRATAHILARTSVEIVCHADLVGSLLQQQNLPQLCGLEFAFGDPAVGFVLAAQVLTHRRMSQHEYALVLLFRHEDAEQEQHLEQRLVGYGQQS